MFAYLKATIKYKNKDFFKDAKCTIIATSNKGEKENWFYLVRFPDFEDFWVKKNEIEIM